MAWHSGLSSESPGSGSGWRSRRAWQWLALVLTALLAWWLFRAYQSPDFVLDFAAFRLC